MRSWITASLVLGFASNAFAGGGPWVLGVDDRSTYVGLSYTRWSQFSGPDGKSEGDVLDLGAAFTRTDIGADVTYGIARRTEVEVSGTLAFAAVSRDGGGVCVEIERSCHSTLSPSPVSARLKTQLLDELSGSPLSVAGGLTFRFGDFTRDTRMRITAVGDGQTDLGLFASVGRTGAVGNVSVAANLDATARYRLALSKSTGNKAPPNEIQLTTEWMVYPVPSVSVGVAADWLQSLGGLDFDEIDLADPDRFAALSVTSAKVGGKLNVRSLENVTVSVSAFGTVYARNNPGDFFTLGVGVGTFRPSHRER